MPIPKSNGQGGKPLKHLKNRAILHLSRPMGDQKGVPLDSRDVRHGIKDLAHLGGIAVGQNFPGP
jgi:hypothetical protein